MYYQKFNYMCTLCFITPLLMAAIATVLQLNQSSLVTKLHHNYGYGRVQLRVRRYRRKQGGGRLISQPTSYNL